MVSRKKTIINKIKIRGKGIKRTLKGFPKVWKVFSKVFHWKTVRATNFYLVWLTSKKTKKSWKFLRLCKAAIANFCKAKIFIFWTLEFFQKLKFWQRVFIQFFFAFLSISNNMSRIYLEQIVLVNLCKILKKIVKILKN